MKEEDIRKRDVFNKYLKLAEEDAVRFFTDKSSFISIKCPACDSSNLEFEFEKRGFRYVSCRNCATIFVNPRPSFEELKNFYTVSPSTKFWVNEFFKPVAESRREKIFKPRVEYIYEKFPKDFSGIVGDIGAGFGLFLEELKKIWLKARLIAIEPSPEQADICRSKGLEVQCCTMEEIKGLEEQLDLLTTFELFEHLFDPRDFLNRVRSILKPDGCFLMTTLNAHGFDIQLLWEKSKSLSPPQHLNFFNPQSITLLLKKCGFEIIEVSTPGRLDWDITEGMIKNEGIKPGRFWEFLTHSGSQECKNELQDWISRNKLSSHMQILAQKRRVT